MILYGAVPYLLVAALPVIVLLAVMLGGCTMTRTAADPAQADRAHQARFYADPDRAAGKQLKKELEQREASAELRRIVDEAQR